MMRTLTSLAMLLLAIGLLAAGPGGASAPTDSKAVGGTLPPRHTAETIHGRVVWLDEALKRRYDITTDPAASQTSVVVETPRGQLVPLVPDVRGWAFTIDSRLRDADLELLVRRHAGLPLVQVIRVLKRKDGGLYEIDYWCDVCAISMFTLKSCECCQGPTRLRETRVDE
jgi:hypothetical protein